MSGCVMSVRALSGFTLPPVLNPNLVGRGRVGNLSERLADERVRFLSLFRRRGLAGSDRPNRFVSDDGLVQFLRAQLGETAFELPRQDFFHVAPLALFERFTDADDGAQEPLRARPALCGSRFHPSRQRACAARCARGQRNGRTDRAASPG